MPNPSELAGKRVLSGHTRTTRKGDKFRRFAVQTDVGRWFVVEVRLNTTREQTDPETSEVSTVPGPPLSFDQQQASARSLATAGVGTKVTGDETKVKAFLAALR